MKCVLSLWLLISVTITSWAVSFEDSNFRVTTRDEDFLEQKNPDATIADAATLARKITLEYLKPRVYYGEMTTADLKLLQFCFYAMGTQAEQTYRQSAYVMGIGGSGRSVEYVLNDIKQKPQAISSWRKIKPLPSNSKLESFARSYSKNQLQHAFLDFDELQNRIVESRLIDGGGDENRVTELERYRKYAQYSFGGAKVLGGVVGVAGGAVAGGAVMGTKLGAGLGTIGVPGVGTVVGGVVGGAVGGAVGGISGILLMANTDKDKYLEKKVPGNLRKIELRLKGMNDRISYQKYVLEDVNSPYRRAYMDLVYVASLIDYCRSHKWDGLEVTDYEKKMWDGDFEKCFIKAKAMATELEKTFVTYPLMMEFFDLNACVLYYWYLESEFDEREIISKAREDYLSYASDIADMGSRYAAHSTDPISIHTLEDYNEIFQWSFSTNKIDITDSKIIDEEFSRLVKNTSPILDDQYESQVKSALVNVKREIPQTDVMMSREEICENKYLKDVVGGIIGGKNLDDWCRQVEKMNERNWLYPTWCDKIKVRSNPPKSEDVVRIVRYYRNEDAGLWVKTVAEALLKMTGCSDEMKSLMEIVCDEDELDEMKDEILDTIDDRKLAEILETRIKDDYGSQEKMVESWLKILSDKSMPDVSQLQSRIEKDILGHWKMIRACDEKSWWNPSRWF